MMSTNTTMRRVYALIIAALIGLFLAITPTMPAYAASFVVNSTNDANDGTCNATHCSLREAITAANASAGSDVITFSLGTATISPSGALPILSSNGTTIYGAGTITLNGSGAGSLASGLQIIADNVKVQGLTITNFDGTAAILMHTAANTTIGVDGNGTNDNLEGNVLINTDGPAIFMDDSSNNVIAGNKIGVGADGSTEFPNLGMGISIHNGSENNRIGTNVNGVSDSLEPNVISGNGGHGIWVDYSDDNNIVGNYIGVDSTGTQPRGNGSDGVRIRFSDSTDVWGNWIGDNGGSGIVLDSASHNVIRGNLIGTDVAQTIDLGNTYHGIHITGGPAGASSYNQIGTEPYPNQFEADGNYILFNGLQGVTVTSATGATYARYNSILYNNMRANGLLGIQLHTGGCVVWDCNDGVTANDNYDPDGGSNDALNFPLMISAKTNGTETYLQAKINNGIALTSLIVQFHHTISCDPSGHGEGYYIGETTVFTNLSSDASTGIITLPTSLPIGSYVSATATTTGASPLNTSEFSACMQVVQGNKYTVGIAITNQMLIDIAQMVTDQQLSQADADSLRATLNLAISAMNRENAALATSHLNDFKRQVNGLLNAQQIPQPEAQYLLDEADEAIRVLGWP